jgi:hypothetical protein
MGDTLNLNEVTAFIIFDGQENVQVEVGHAILRVVPDFHRQNLSRLERHVLVRVNCKVALLELLWVAGGK